MLDVTYLKAILVGVALWVTNHTGGGGGAWAPWAPGQGGVVVEDGPVGLVVHQVGHVAPLLLLAGPVPGPRPRGPVEVGVGPWGVAADGSLVPPVGAGLERRGGWGTGLHGVLLQCDFISDLRLGWMDVISGFVF